MEKLQSCQEFLHHSVNIYNIYNKIDNYFLRDELFFNNNEFSPHNYNFGKDVPYFRNRNNQTINDLVRYLRNRNNQTNNDERSEHRTFLSENETKNSFLINTDLRILDYNFTLFFGH